MIKDKKEYEDLVKRGALCKLVKDSLKKDLFKTKKEIREYVLDLCKKNDYKQSFPTMVMCGSQVANFFAEDDYVNNLENQSIYTVDFGFNSDLGHPCDNSYSVVRDPALKELVDRYQEITFEIEEELRIRYLKNGMLKISEISALVKQTFSKDGRFYLLMDCDAHTIGKNNLHETTIPMNYDSEKDFKLLYGLSAKSQILKKGTVFTLEPHVLAVDHPIGLQGKLITWEEENKHVVGLKSHDKVEYYVKKELPSEVLEKNHVLKVTQTRANRRSFFFENTFVLTDTLERIT